MDNKALKSALEGLKRVILGEETPKEDNPLQEYVTDSGDTLYSDNLEVGGELQDAEKQVIESGEFKLEDGRTIIVEDSKITEIKEAEVVEEEDVVLEQDPEVEPEAEAEPQPSQESVMKAIAELLKLDMSVDGWYTIDFSVADGVVAWGELMTNSYKTLMSEQKEAHDAKVSELENRIAEQDAKAQDLNTKLSAQEVKLSEAGKLIEVLEKGIGSVEDFKETKEVNVKQKKQVKQVKMSKVEMDRAILRAKRNK